MQAGYSVELGREDPALELPWSSDDGRIHYYDLKRHPELVLQVREALTSPELSAFLTRVNDPRCPLQTAKCDLWYSTELFPEEDIFQGPGKFVSYVDLVFTEAAYAPGSGESGEQAHLSAPRLVFERHESLAKDVCTLLKRAPEMGATVELVIRRCYFHVEGHSGHLSSEAQSENGFCITTYVSGFGQMEAEARERWAIALSLLQHALVQVTSR